MLDPDESSLGRFSGLVKIGNLLSLCSLVPPTTTGESIFRHAAALVVVLDTKGRIVCFNHACEKATEYTFDEVKDKSLWDLFIFPEEVASLSIKYFLL